MRGNFIELGFVRKGMNSLTEVVSLLKRDSTKNSEKEARPGVLALIGNGKSETFMSLDLIKKKREGEIKINSKPLKGEKPLQVLAGFDDGKSKKGDVGVPWP